jgi:hypothetical protein
VILVAQFSASRTRVASSWMQQADHRSQLDEMDSSGPLSMWSHEIQQVPILNFHGYFFFDKNRKNFINNSSS